MYIRDRLMNESLKTIQVVRGVKHRLWDELCEALEGAYRIMQAV